MVSDVKKIASLVTKPWPVICEKDLPFGAGFYLIQELGRLVQISPQPTGTYYLVTYKSKNTRREGLRLAAAGRFGLWKMTPE